MMTSRPYIDYYKENKVSPVPNEYNEKIRKTRASLYLQLGIVPSFVQNKKVIEFGPGNGVNSIYTYSLNPREYALVDGNSLGIENCKKNFAKAYTSTTGLSYHESFIEDFNSNHDYDLVICEGLIPHQINPKQFLKDVAKHVKVGGLLVITTHDLISNFSEILRGFLGYLVSKQCSSFDEKVDILCTFFNSHFEILKSMSRSHKDWVIDNILQVEYWKESPLCSIGDSIETLNEGFLFHKSSPGFFNDWRWYKQCDADDNALHNQYFLKSYHKNVHNLIDFRSTFQERETSANLTLLSTIRESRQAMSNYIEEPNDGSFALIVDCLTNVHHQLQTFSSETAKSLINLIEFLRQWDGTSSPVDLKEFKDWWGRGMQYASFIRNKE